MLFTVSKYALIVVNYRVLTWWMMSFQHPVRILGINNQLLSILDLDVARDLLQSRWPRKRLYI